MITEPKRMQHKAGEVKKLERTEGRNATSILMEEK
jgi:hypothetical protein